MDAVAVDRLLDGKPYVAVVRGADIESMHRVAACAVDRDGRTIFSQGTIDVPVYLRSTAKPFIAAAAVREGVIERFGLEPREIAVMAASHDGEPFHIEAVRSMLAKIGLTEAALQCGPHAPYDSASALALAAAGIPFSAVHNNCSGKHAGILALCRVLDADIQTYLLPGNPAQQHILALCARLCDEPLQRLRLGVDGCGIPVFATPLRHAALAFSRMATLEGIDRADARALHVVRDAMLAFPQYVSGTHGFDSVLMHVAGGRIVAKSGAEGVHGMAAIATGTGLVLKVVDGAARACAPAALQIARELELLNANALERLQSFARPATYNRAGTQVGEIAPLAQLGAGAPAP